MVEQLNEKILRDFRIGHHLYELVEAGQDMPHGIPAEEAPALIVSPLTIRNTFNNDNIIAFYIRMLPVTEDRMDRNDTLGTIVAPEIETPCCMVCQESPPILTRYFGCSHYICDTCCVGCINADINRCALCRRQR